MRDTRGQTSRSVSGFLLVGPNQFPPPTLVPSAPGRVVKIRGRASGRTRGILALSNRPQRGLWRHKDGAGESLEDLEGV
jgi:hypothetical protein